MARARRPRELTGRGRRAGCSCALGWSAWRSPAAARRHRRPRLRRLRRPGRGAAVARRAPRRPRRARRRRQRRRPASRSARRRSPRHRPSRAARGWSPSSTATRSRSGSPTARRETVRLVGIDTPESRRPQTPVECGAKQAAAALRRLVARRDVTLVRDPTPGRARPVRADAGATSTWARGTRARRWCAAGGRSRTCTAACRSSGSRVPRGGVGGAARARRRARGVRERLSPARLSQRTAH